MPLYTLFGIAFLLIGSSFANFNIIGASNKYRDPKKERKINIEKSKIRKFVPYHGQHFHLPWVKVVSPYFDGTVFVKTYVLAIVNLVTLLIEILFFATFFIFYIIDSLV